MGYLLDLAKAVKKRPVRLSSLCNEKNEFNEISSPSVFIPNQTPPKIVESGGVIWRNPYPQGTREARQETLREIMIAMWETTFKRILVTHPSGFASTHNMLVVEAEVNGIYILAQLGNAQFADYRRAVEAWQATVIQEINTTD